MNDSDVKKIPMVSIVEDDVSVQKSLKRSIRLLGFDCQAYETAESFLESVDTTDCLVSDIVLPGMSGLELQDKMRSTRPNVPILLMTASAEKSIETRGVANGAAGFFRKPFDMDRMLECLQQVLNDHRMSRHSGWTPPD